MRTPKSRTTRRNWSRSRSRLWLTPAAQAQLVVAPAHNNVSEPKPHESEDALELASASAPVIVEKNEEIAPEEAPLAPNPSDGAGVPLHEEPPFDPPDEDDEIFRCAEPTLDPEDADLALIPEPGPEADSELVLESAVSATPPEATVSAPELQPEANPERRVAERPAPPIIVHAHWERPEIAVMLNQLSADRQLARARIMIARNFLVDGPQLYASETSPDLLIFDTALPADPMLAALDQLTPIVRANTKILIIGAVNDVGLLRALAKRGVSQYLLSPDSADAIVTAICALYADTDASRVVSILGARGGVGASTIAYNVACAIADRRDASVSLVELDLPFGVAGFQLGAKLSHSIADALRAPDRVDDAILERISIAKHEHLRVFAAPANLVRDGEPDPQALTTVLRRIRRTSSVVVLDLPHLWTPWVKRALVCSDEVLIVATPDLASLRNTKNILERLKTEHPRCDPFLLLSKVGGGGRAEISARDFAESVGADPVASIAFDPALFGLCAINGQTIAEAAPRSETTRALDALASSLTGRQLPKRETPKRRKSDQPPAFGQESAPAAQKESRKEPSPPPKSEKPDVINLDEPTRFPFTFGAPAEQVTPAPLVLVDIVSAPIKSGVLEKAREAALAGHAGHAPAPRKTREPKTRKSHTGELRRGRPGILRAAALVVAIIGGGLWYARNQAPTAQAAAPAMHAVAMPAHPGDAPKPPVSPDTPR